MLQPAEEITVTPIIVKKAEEIKWSFTQDWIHELLNNIDVYSKVSRYKSKANKQLAEALKAKLEIIKNRPDRYELVKIDIIPLLQKRNGIKKKGFNKKRSYMYKLCEVALEKLPAHLEVVALANKYEAQIIRLRDEISGNKETITTLKSEIEDLKGKTIKELEHKLNHMTQKKDEKLKEVNTFRLTLDDSQNKLIASLNENKALISTKVELNKQIHTRELKIRELEDHLKHTQEELDNKKTEITYLQVRPKLELYEALQEECKKLKAELAELKRIKQDQLETQQEKQAEYGKMLEEKHRVIQERDNLKIENTKLVGFCEIQAKDNELLHEVIASMANFIDKLFGTSISGTLASRYFTDNVLREKLKQEKQPLLSDDQLNAIKETINKALPTSSNEEKPVVEPSTAQENTSTSYVNLFKEKFLEKKEPENVSNTETPKTPEHAEHPDDTESFALRIRKRIFSSSSSNLKTAPETTVDQPTQSDPEPVAVENIQYHEQVKPTNEDYWKNVINVRNKAQQSNSITPEQPKPVTPDKPSFFDRIRKGADNKPPAPVTPSIINP